MESLASSAGLGHGWGQAVLKIKVQTLWPSPPHGLLFTPTPALPHFTSYPSAASLPVCSFRVLGLTLLTVAPGPGEKVVRLAWSQKPPPKPRDQATGHV